MDQLVGMLTSSLQYAVSGDKIRYRNGDFDLDLTYGEFIFRVGGPICAAR
jgi:hypothetical protein